MTNNISYTKLLKWFLKEEWRLFTTLFGQIRFVTFPIIIFTFAIILGAASPILNTSTEYLLFIYLLLITIFGIQTGSIGFEARDSINNLIGETSRILYASKTLPIKKQQLVLLFLIKDAIFYSLMFLAPITIGVLLGLVITPIESFYVFNLSILIDFGLLYLMTILVFMFGVSIGFVFTTIRLERITGLIILSFLIALGYSLFTFDNFSIDYIMNISLLYLINLILFFTALFISFGLIQFRNPDKLAMKSKFKNRYKSMSDLISPSRNSTKIMMKNLIDIQRSAGGFLKIIFSASTIVLTAFMLVYFMNSFFGLAAKYEFIYASLFALMTYPIYNIMFRYDSIETYSILPISKLEVYKAKVILFSIISIPLSIILYTAFIITNVTIVFYIKGVIILLSLQYYQLGLLMFFGGDDPHRLLFDGISFSIYSIATLIFIIPILVIGMYGLIISSTIIYGIVLWGVVSGVIGFILIHYVLKNNLEINNI